MKKNILSGEEEIRENIDPKKSNFNWSDLRTKATFFKGNLSILDILLEALLIKSKQLM